MPAVTSPTDALRSAAGGISRGLQRLGAAADRVADEGAGAMPDAAIEARLAAHQVRASVAVARVADDLLGGLIDDLA